jgi:ribosomal protein L11 methyltransferase
MLMVKRHEDAEVIPKEKTGRRYDALVANILAVPLVTLAPTLAGLLKPDGVLGLSGILAPQADMVIEAYKEYFDNVKVDKEVNGWVLISGVRKS